ncbi:MAG: tetratricopeptide repeat protein [Chitinophagales bacterium]|nr:tetratricopeptide repeat protein [Bacteroidota bacterium]MCB9042977.1 tetratricopeptide repeat protein [Chitinophagales bacterium]
MTPKQQIHRIILSASLLLFCILSVWQCTPSSSEKARKNQSPYLNHAENVAYIGSEQCAACHPKHYETFMQTGMGQSFYFATPQKSKARFGEHALVYDTLNNMYYKPYFKGDSMYIKEFRLAGKDTVHQFDLPIQYIIGSGQHTNSHIYSVNGYLYQAPVTFYTQEGIWDVAPGFTAAASARFDRIIGSECMNCHNSHPMLRAGSENKFHQVPLGIGCERCHGPGALHQKEKLAGNIINTSQYIDYTIVNPRKLPRHLQMNVCQRCHAQGVSVLQAEKDFLDFKPGMPLEDVMDIYLPQYSGAQTQFIMASHAERLAKSACYKNSEMTCITCHNPHVSVKQTSAEHFNTKCTQCHASNTENFCTASESERQQQNNNCFACHMPMSTAIDIPHVKIHDHFIRQPITVAQRQEVEQFIGLQCVNNANPSDLSKAKAYLDFYEKFNPSQKELVDTAIIYIQKLSISEQTPLWVHAYYLQNKWDRVVEKSKHLLPEKTQDAWTAYRIGQAYYNTNNATTALVWFERAIEILPLQLDFLTKKGATLAKLNKWNEAKIVFEEVLKENPQHVAALSNLGFVLLNLGDIDEARTYYEKALQIRPDYTMAQLNLAAWYILQRQNEKALPHLKNVLEKDPNNLQAKMMLRQLQGI